MLPIIKWAEVRFIEKRMNDQVESIWHFFITHSCFDIWHLRQYKNNDLDNSGSALVETRGFHANTNSYQFFLCTNMSEDLLVSLS